MFKTVIIDQYRGIKHLQLDNLALVNLFVGKNNTGKTSILEAISILAFNEILRDEKRGSTHENLRALFGWIYKLPFDRNFEDFSRHYTQGRNPIELNREVFSSIMYGRSAGLFSSFTLKGKLYNDFDLGADYISERVMLMIAGEYHKTLPSTNPETGKIEYQTIKHAAKSIEDLQDDSLTINSVREILLCERNSGNTGHGNTYELGYDFNSDKKISERLSTSLGMQYIKTNGLNNYSNSLLYDNIIFDSIKMDNLIYALRIIEPDVERFAYQSNEFGERSARIKFKNNDKVFPITTMGDGMNRILTLILSLVNCEGGTLIVDEIENGLHYSVQKDLWIIIFKLAKIFKIQVFATTHSSDTINSFSEVLASEKDASAAKAFRIQRNQDDTFVVDYDQKELSTSTKFDVEIR